LKASTPRPDNSRPGQGAHQGLRGVAPRVVSLLTDYGLADGFVGALHSVLRARLPLVPIVDLTHEVRGQDVRAGSLALKRAAPYLAEGVVVAIVDPGVGTRRRPVAVRPASADITFIGPDNGLLPPAIDVLGGPVIAVELDNPAYRLSAPGPTFAGRDIFAPAAAFLAGGGDLSALGQRVDTGTLVRLPPPEYRERGGWFEIEVTWVDRYGNVQLAAGPDALHGRRGFSVARARPSVSQGPGKPPTDPAAPNPGASRPNPGASWPNAGASRPNAGDSRPNAGASRPNTGAAWPARVVHTFADLAPGELGILVDSYGSLALCLNGASAADLLGATEQDVYSLRPIDGEREAAATAPPPPEALSPTTGPPTTGPPTTGPPTTRPPTTGPAAS
jgi:S-adenosyl-L-methionine hydrolase (adenosine-forming)